MKTINLAQTFQGPAIVTKILGRYKAALETA